MAHWWVMSEENEHPELAGYEPGDGRPLRSPRLVLVMRFVVIVGIACLVLPGVFTTVSVASSTAEAACIAWVAYEAPEARGASARFEIFGPGGIGWECYTIGAFGGDRHVASLGLIPMSPKLSRVPVPGTNSSGQLPTSSLSRTSRRSTLPMRDLGNSSTATMRLGTLYAARQVRA